MEHPPPGRRASAADLLAQERHDDDQHRPHQRQRGPADVMQDRVNRRKDAVTPRTPQRRAQGDVVRLDSQTTFLGIDPAMTGDPGQDSVSVSPEDLLVFYTDGLQEAANANGEQVGLAGLCSLVCECASEPIDQIPTIMFDRIGEFRDGPPQDDMMLLALTYTS